MPRNSAVDEHWLEVARSLCFKDEKHMYEVLYLQEGLSVNDIAERLEVGSATLNRRMHAFHIPKRPRGGARKTADKKQFLWYLDQRNVIRIKSKVLGIMYDISYSVIYNYKRWKAGGSFVGQNMSATGALRSMEDVRR